MYINHAGRFDDIALLQEVFRSIDKIVPERSIEHKGDNAQWYSVNM